MLTRCNNFYFSFSRFSFSTPQHLNISTAQPLNLSTSQPLNRRERSLPCRRRTSRSLYHPRTRATSWWPGRKDPINAGAKLSAIVSAGRLSLQSEQILAWATAAAVSLVAAIQRLFGLVAPQLPAAAH